jgi:hypothetical protein
MRLVLCVAWIVAGAHAFVAYSPACPVCASSRVRVSTVRAVADSDPAPQLETYSDAERRGFELFQAGEHERAIRMFELAQVGRRAPGAVDSAQSMTPAYDSHRRRCRATAST